MRALLLTVLASISVAFSGQAASGQAASGQGVPGQPGTQQVALVELFTSEGCSSCPPADALLKKIAGTHVAGTLVVALSEHVTYWNSLGWRDPFSQELFTRRQNDYGDRFRLQSVYTPQVVVNGQREVLGSDSVAVAKAVGASGAPAILIKLEGAITDGRQVHVSYKLGAVPAGAEVFAVVAEDLVSSNVARGENGGRTLTHVAVATGLVKLGSAKEGAGTALLALPDGERKRHVVIFVQEAGLGRVLGVDSREL